MATPTRHTASPRTQIWSNLEALLTASADFERAVQQLWASRARAGTPLQTDCLGDALIRSALDQVAKQVLEAIDQREVYFPSADARDV